jgi:hypothetical protein
MKLSTSSTWDWRFLQWQYTNIDIHNDTYGVTVTIITEKGLRILLRLKEFKFAPIVLLAIGVTITQYFIVCTYAYSLTAVIIRT